MADRARLLKQLRLMEDTTTARGASENEAAVALRLAAKIREALGAIDPGELEEATPLEYVDVDRYWQEREDFDRNWAKEAVFRIGRHGRRWGNAGAQDERRWLNLLEMGVLPTEDAWITRGGTVVSMELHLDRLIREAEIVLADYLHEVQRIRTKSRETRALPTSIGDVDETPWKAYEILPLDVWDAAVAQTKAKLRCVRAELMRRGKNPLETGAKTLSG